MWSKSTFKTNHATYLEYIVTFIQSYEINFLQSMMTINCLKKYVKKNKRIKVSVTMSLRLDDLNDTNTLDIRISKSLTAGRILPLVIEVGLSDNTNQHPLDQSQPALLSIKLRSKHKNRALQTKISFMYFH